MKSIELSLESSFQTQVFLQETYYDKEDFSKF